ncbi:BQ2448_6068 [Microbotryum intermedium]|uniref:BQ2448_6068 protein n=1 Tax=Microbotryum intermedium TaxID=269621 RepID=A0A238FR12_9BASI|nr:BQ2448_6068 [Microbotryum intermedium]
MTTLSSDPPPILDDDEAPPLLNPSSSSSSAAPSIDPASSSLFAPPSSSSSLTTVPSGVSDPVAVAVPSHTPCHAEVFQLIASGSTATPSTNDPNLSLRPRHERVPIELDSAPYEQAFLDDAEADDEPHTLSEYKAFEGPVRRLSIFRTLFDSIPIPTSPPTSPVASTSTLADASALASSSTSSSSSSPSASQQADQDARDRKTYARELWCKCNDLPGSSLNSAAAASTATTASPLGTDASLVTTSTSASAPSEPTKTPRSTPSTPIASAAARWSAFEKYAEEKEKELWKVFVEFDSDQDMKLRVPEVRQACKRAGLEIKDGILDDFMKTVDKDGDGAISFAEWRNFLLLLPRPTSMPEIMHYYQTHRKHRPSMSRLTQDGDVVIGGGKTGWNRLMTKSAAASKSASVTSQQKKVMNSSAALAILQDATNLRKCETENDEKRWARECVECWASKAGSIGAVKKGKAVESMAATKAAVAKEVLTTESVAPMRVVDLTEKSTTSAAAAAAATIATTTADSGTSSSAHLTLPVVEDEQVDELQHGMFAGAGKFLLAGGLAGAVSRTATAPFDRLKVYLITSPSTLQPIPPRYVPSLGSPEAAAPSRPTKKVRRGKGSIPAAVRAIWRQGGGPAAFWTGNGLNVIKIFPESAIKFLSYESAKRVFAQYWDRVPDQTMISNSSRFVSGGIGGVLSQFVIYPIETLKTRVMSSTGGEHKGNALIFETAKNIWRKGGVKLYFRGLPAGLIGVFPYSAIDMSTFEGIKLAYTKWAGEEPGIPGSLAFGALSGGVGATSVYPLNLVRTRLQAQGTPAHPQTYTGVCDAARKCYQREGWRGFYKGLTPTLVKVVPAVAISYAVYDASKKVLFGQEEGCHSSLGAGNSSSGSAHKDEDCTEE